MEKTHAYMNQVKEINDIPNEGEVWIDDNKGMYSLLVMRDGNWVHVIDFDPAQLKMFTVQFIDEMKKIKLL